MFRTQLYLTEAQREGLGRLAREVGRSQSELIREAIDRLLAAPAAPGWQERLGRARGMWAGREGLDELVDDARRSLDRDMASADR